MLKTAKSSVCAIGVPGLVANLCFGQDYRGRIQGTITDSSQSAVPNATVTLTM